MKKADLEKKEKEDAAKRQALEEADNETKSDFMVNAEREEEDKKIMKNEVDSLVKEGAKNHEKALEAKKV